MPDRSNAEIARACFGAYRDKDLDRLDALLAEDFRFTSPYDDAIDKQTYFERCWPNSDRIRTHIIERIFEQGDEAVVQYRCITNAGYEFRNAELFRFVGGRIAAVTVFFGPEYREGRFVAARPPG